jgi:hypothetical protein
MTDCYCTNTCLFFILRLVTTVQINLGPIKNQANTLTTRSTAPKRFNILKTGLESTPFLRVQFLFRKYNMPCAHYVWPLMLGIILLQTGLLIYVDWSFLPEWPWILKQETGDEHFRVELLATVFRKWHRIYTHTVFSMKVSSIISINFGIVLYKTWDCKTVLVSDVRDKEVQIIQFHS